VDPEGEYRELVRRLGGSWVDLVSEAAIDPFDLGDDAASACATVVDVCALLCPGITEDERAAVEAAARAVLGWRRAGVEHPGRPELPPGGTRLRECARLLDQTAPRVARVLTRFLDGSLAGFLDRPTSPAWSEPLLAVGHREVREEVVPVTTYLLGRMLWQIARHSPRRRHIVIDEVGMLSAHPPLRSLLAQLARRARKYGSSLVVATQNVQDLLSTEEGTVVASNCAILLCGGHRAVEVAAMERAFGLTEEQRRRLERAGRGEFVLLAGNRRGIIEVDLPDAYRAMIRGDDDPPTP
jgi:type IV secretory pathway VirB4 component